VVHGLEIYLIDVAPPERLAGRNGLHDRMVGRLEMFCSVLILRAIATADMAAGEAHPQVYPCIANLDAILANHDVLRMDILDLIFVGTNFFG